MHKLRWNALLVALLVSTGLVVQGAHGDGDPLESYDFSGKVPARKFTLQSRTRNYRHGLWTVQRYTSLDPFEGGIDGRKTFDLGGNGVDRICVYYGTRPLWQSGTHYKTWFERQERVRSSSGSFWLRGEDTYPLTHPMLHPGMPPEIKDVTGGPGTTLLLRSWGGGSHTNGTTLIRLSGTTPADARVDVLFEGAYEAWRDIDGDGHPEIIATDFTHASLNDMHARGSPDKVILAWNAELDRYRVANDRFYLRALHPKVERSTWGQELLSRWEEAMTAHTATEGKPVESEAERATAEAFFIPQLASDLHGLLAVGLVAGARALHAGITLPTYGTNWAVTAGTDAVPHTKASWWAAYVARVKASRTYEDLCALYPKLRDLS